MLGWVKGLEKFIGFTEGRLYKLLRMGLSRDVEFLLKCEVETRGGVGLSDKSKVHRTG